MHSVCFLWVFSQFNILHVLKNMNVRVCWGMWHGSPNPWGLNMLCNSTRFETTDHWPYPTLLNPQPPPHPHHPIPAHPLLPQRLIAEPSPFFSLGRKAAVSHGYNHFGGCSTSSASQLQCPRNPEPEAFGSAAPYRNTWSLFLVTVIRKHNICFQLGPLHPPTPTHTHTFRVACSLQFHRLHFTALPWTSLSGLIVCRQTVRGSCCSVSWIRESGAQRLNTDCVQNKFKPYFTVLTIYL